MNINPINLIPANELGKDSKIKLSVCDTEHDLYWRMAIEVLETIKANNEKGEDTELVLLDKNHKTVKVFGGAVNYYNV